MVLLDLLDTKVKDRLHSVLKQKSLEVDGYLHQLSADLSENIKKTICSYGLTRIDDPVEQKKIAEMITDAVGKAITAPYSIAWPILKPLVYQVALEMIEKAAKVGAHYCDGVSCGFSPIPLSGDLIGKFIEAGTD